MRLGSVVRVSPRTVIIVVLLSLFAFSLVLFNRLDYVTLVDEAVPQTRDDMCRCGVAEYGPSDDQQLHVRVADGSMTTTRGIQAAESNIVVVSLRTSFSNHKSRTSINVFLCYLCVPCHRAVQ